MPAGRRSAPGSHEHAAALKGAGLGFAWHNHAFEYVTLPTARARSSTCFPAPTSNGRPTSAGSTRGGADIATELAKFKGKVAAFHIKDMAPAGVTVDDGWTDIGAGTLDWKALWPAIESAGTDLLVFEHDAPSDWESFARNSYAFVAGLIGRKG